jgi:CheY-like chemotaxis protein
VGLNLMHRPRVLVVDDSEVGRGLLLGQLSYLGFDAEAVDNGSLAVQKAAEGQFDVILMDIFMPGIDGLEATRRIRQQEQETGSKRKLIIAVTGGADKQTCLDAGLDDYVSKPILLDDVKRVLLRWLSPVRLHTDLQPKAAS